MKMVRQTRRNISEDPIGDQTCMSLLYLIPYSWERHKDSESDLEKKQLNKKKKKQNTPEETDSDRR